MHVQQNALSVKREMHIQPNCPKIGWSFWIVQSE
jgi:hypothetical protein